MKTRAGVDRGQTGATVAFNRKAGKATGPKNVADLKFDKDNARDHSERSVDAIASSLTEFGPARSIVIDEAGRVRAGEGTVKAARKAGIKKLKIVDADRDTLVAVRVRGLDEGQLARLSIADNRTAELSKWKPDILKAAAASGKLEGLSFSAKELAILTNEKGHAGRRRDIDEAPTGRATDIQPGQVFALGAHRLFCGDSTKLDDVQGFLKTTGVERCGMMFTDPPYGVMFQSKGSKGVTSIAGDISQATIPVSMAVAVDQVLDANARIYVCGGQDNLGMYLSLFDHHLRQLPKIIVWKKNGFVMRPNNYHSAFEFIYFGWKGKGGGPSFWFGDRTQTDIWEVDRDPAKEYQHPTQKPVELAEKAITNSSPVGGWVFEPFAGSGSTLIACQAQGRKCLAIEQAPMFCQVIIDRWETFTGEKAERVA